ncbi:hypothetical protein BB934_45815 (plasmid) [Microvirga ossetica]|uniref:Collagen-like protein n=1 Tax=Microvirga ossetica TaxID=1882682 RepID=A0A1B2EZW7_9HYPH|nr:hypothetical protein [Microvirga ossetica]ANY85539.1 hypothetical protein BB934_45815 [Microvirga ossetica]
MKRSAYLLAFLFVSTSSYALDLPKWPSGPVAVLPKGEFVISEDTTLSYDKLTVPDGTIITTNGNDFDLQIRQELIIQGSTVIRSFAPTHVPDAPPQAATGGPGRSYERGPNTEGATVATKGNDGGQGMPGQTGQPGVAGDDAGFITLRFDPGARADGRLIVRNTGGIGGIGGVGGQGGPGGDGQQGGRGKDGIVDCASGPGNGGNGGDGGPGGLGGRGGDGGRGGTIVVQTSAPANPPPGSMTILDWLQTVEMSVDGGTPGQPGPGGKGGNPGQPGYGGRGSHHCQGKEADRMGAPGKPGKNETAGLSGANKGPNGRIKKL